MKFLKGRRYTNKDIQDGRWNKVKAFLCVSFVCSVGCVHMHWLDVIKFIPLSKIILAFLPRSFLSSSWRIFFLHLYTIKVFSYIYFLLAFEGKIVLKILNNSWYIISAKNLVWLRFNSVQLIDIASSFDTICNFTSCIYYWTPKTSKMNCMFCYSKYLKGNGIVHGRKHCSCTSILHR